jgi:hypothetical protein
MCRHLITKALLVEIIKYLISKIILMTELGFELRNIEMKAGHTIPIFPQI